MEGGIENLPAVAVGMGSFYIVSLALRGKTGKGDHEVVLVAWPLIADEGFSVVRTKDNDARNLIAEKISHNCATGFMVSAAVEDVRRVFHRPKIQQKGRYSKPTPFLRLVAAL
jgi:hypothetical protein